MQQNKNISLIFSFKVKIQGFSPNWKQKEKMNKLHTHLFSFCFLQAFLKTYMMKMKMKMKMKMEICRIRTNMVDEKLIRYKMKMTMIKKIVEIWREGGLAHQEYPKAHTC